jgi:hypothetical protein
MNYKGHIFEKLKDVDKNCDFEREYDNFYKCKKCNVRIFYFDDSYNSYSKYNYYHSYLDYINLLCDEVIIKMIIE